MARKYQLKRRAERQEETRRRIVEATVALHESVGGAGATISAIAERAGVERLTVYRHFPDERTLVTACTQHYWAQNPPPDPTPWHAITDPETRLRTGLAAIYAYHRRTERMSLRASHDTLNNPLLREILAPQFAYWREVHDILAAVWLGGNRAQGQVEAAVGHAIGFMTWYSLVREQGLDDAQAIELMVAMLRCIECAARDTS
jgi:AcrR family transcriptional regulator